MVTTESDGVPPSPRPALRHRSSYSQNRREHLDAAALASRDQVGRKNDRIRVFGSSRLATPLDDMGDLRGVRPCLRRTIATLEFLTHAGFAPMLRGARRGLRAGVAATKTADRLGLVPESPPAALRR
jgi:hypothetical protein